MYSQQTIAPVSPHRGLLIALCVITVASVWASVAMEEWAFLGFPVGYLVLWLAVVDFKALFFLLMASIPISTEAELPGGLATDLPSEPLMWLLTAAGLGWLLRHGQRLDGRFIRHPITLALFLHIAWMLVAVVLSDDFMVSFKFFLAKTWYLGVFYFLAGRFLVNERDYKRFIWWFFIPLIITVISVLVRHAPLGFTFETSNRVLSPFYRNHVMYACILAVFLPFVWYATYWYKRGSGLWWLLFLGIILMLVGINFAYTRAAYAALIAAVGLYWLIRWKAVQIALVISTLLLSLFIGFVTYQDNWLLFAPQYERTITHTRFENLLEATTRLEDISIMERVYRWVAASQMIQEKPFTGFGPGNFYFTYKDYTVSSFKTYVSDNPERSGMHNYFLMTTVEQGLPGVFIFIGLCFYALIYGQRIYHRLRSAWRRHIHTAAMLCFALICILMMMNDFVETDKIGSLFFMSLAIMVSMDLQKDEVKEGSADSE